MSIRKIKISVEQAWANIKTHDKAQCLIIMVWFINVHINVIAGFRKTFL